MNNTKEVYFVAWCDKCAHKDKPDYEDPCNECLAQPFMINTHKPLNYKEQK